MNTDNLWYLVAAFSIAWVVLLGYVLSLARRQARAEESAHYLEELVQKREWPEDQSSKSAF